jgi:glycosyltransferase involved in cell wall biosynthesis
MYRLLLIKRWIEDIILLPFIGVGRLIALLKPPAKEYDIYFFFPFYHIGGAEKVHAQVARAAGHPNCIIYFTRKSHNEGFLQEFKQSGCVIKDISKFTDNKWLYFLNLIYRGIITGYINRQQQKPVVFNGQCNFGYKISPWVKKDIRQVELIHSFNSFSFIRTPFLPFISATVMISRQRIADHLRYYRDIGIPAAFDEKIRYIPNAITLPAVAREKSKEQFTVLYVGRGGVEKRLHLIMQIAREVHAKDPAVRFEILGDVSDVINPAEFPFVKFHGNQTEGRLITNIYSAAHLLILTSSTEGFPLVVIEAMASGCAILATPVGDIPLHVKTGVNGYLFSATENEGAIIAEGVNHILELKNNRAALEAMAANNINYAKHNFAIEKFNEAYRKIINPSH